MVVDVSVDHVVDTEIVLVEHLLPAGGREMWDEYEVPDPR